MDFNEWLNKYMYNEETLEFYHNWDLAIAKDAGFSEGKTAGFNEGKSAGFNEGKSAGFNEGKSAGFNEGKTAGFSEGKTAGEKSSKIEIAKKMLQKEIPIKDIASITNLTIEEVKSLKD